MNKKLSTALAIAGALAASAAAAQSSVTVYGRLNTSIEFQDNETIDKVVMRNNSSRWGLRGNEDLGGGLSAYFQLESGFASDTGAGAGGFSRDAYVGLKSNSLGQIKLGKFTSALYYSTIDYIGNFNHDTGTTSEDNLYGLTAGFVNGVEYTSPAFGPVTFAVTANASEGTGPKTYEGVVNFDQGSLHIGAGYSQTKNAADQKTIDGISAAVSYGFGPVNLGLAYEHDKQTLAGGNLGKRDVVTFTGQYNLGNNEFHLSIGKAGEWKNLANSDALQYTLGYNHKLSKRTKVYAFYYAVDNNALVYGGTGDVAALTNKTFSSIGLGLRHNF